MTIAEYLDQPNSKRIITCEIIINPNDPPFLQEKYYVSSGPYVTSYLDTPASMPFAPIIDSTSSPRGLLSLPDLFTGSRSRNYGSIKLSSPIAWDASSVEVDLRTKILRRSQVTLKMAAPAGYYHYYDAVTLFKGSVTGTEKNFDGSYVINYVDNTSEFSTGVVPTARTPDTQASPIPRVWGEVAQCKPLPLYNAGAYAYQVSDAAIVDIVAVSDKGELLGIVGKVTASTATTVTLDPAPDQFSIVSGDYIGLLLHGEVITNHVDNGNGTATFTVASWSRGQPAVNDYIVLHLIFPDFANGKFKLKYAPAGVISAYIKGSGLTDYTSTLLANDFLALFVESVGITSGNHDIAVNASYTAAIQITDPTKISNLFDVICRGYVAWWIFTRSGILKVREWSDPATATADLQLYPYDIIDQNSIVEDERYYWLARGRFNQNNTPLNSLAGSVLANPLTNKTFWTTLGRIWAASSTTLYNAGIRDESPAFDMFLQYNDSASATTICEKMLSLFDTYRYYTTITVSKFGSGLEPGMVVQINDFHSDYDGKWLIVEIEETYSDLPVQKLKLWR